MIDDSKLSQNVANKSSTPFFHIVATPTLLIIIRTTKTCSSSPQILN